MKKIITNFTIIGFAIINIFSFSCKTRESLEWETGKVRTLKYLYEKTTGYYKETGPEKTEKRYELKFIGNNLVNIKENGNALGQFKILRTGELIPDGHSTELPAELELLSVLPERANMTSWERYYPSQSEADGNSDRVILQSKREFVLSDRDDAGIKIQVKGYMRLVQNSKSEKFLSTYVNSGATHLFNWNLSMSGETIFKEGIVKQSSLVMEVPPSKQNKSVEEILSSDWRYEVKLQLEGEE